MRRADATGAERLHLSPDCSIRAPRFECALDVVANALPGLGAVDACHQQLAVIGVLVAYGGDHRELDGVTLYSLP